MNHIRMPFRVLHTQHATPSSEAPHPQLRRASRLLSLEQRFMFDAAAIATAADAVHHNDTQDAAHAAETAAAHLVRAADPGANDGKKEVVFVDTSLANYQALEAGVRAGVAIVEFNGAADGLAQIAQWAQNNTGYDAIHILSHGSEGMLNLGTTVLDAAALASDTVKAELADIGHALNAGGDLLLYGCDVAAGSGGQLFLNDLARLTGADVAASTDATGAAALEGDWVLESHTGDIQARTLQIDGYEGLMGVVNFSSGDIPANTQSVTARVDGYDFAFSAKAGSTLGYRVINGQGGIYSMASSVADGGAITVSAPSGYTFDLTFLYVNWSGASPVATLTVTYADGSTRTVSAQMTAGGTITVPFSTNNMTKFEISAGTTTNFRDFTISNVKQIPVVTDPNISIISTGTGIGGAYKIGDTITAQWNNTASGDNSRGIVAATFDFSQFGGSATVTGTNVNGVWRASYTVTAGNIDAVNRNVTVRASNGSVTRSGADSTNLTIDNIAPTVTSGRISISGATGAGGAYKIGDTVTVTWNNTAAGDNNSDVISGVTVNFGQFGGSTVAATNAGGTWSASYTITAGNIDALNCTASVTVMDNAGNTTARSSGAVKVDNIAPTVVITSSASNLAGGETATITFNFSEDPGASFAWNGASGDLLVVGGTLSAITGSGLTRTAIFTPASNTNNGSATITVTAGSYTDVVGNSSGAAASLSLTYDTQAPNAPSAPVMSSASDTGLSNTDNITRNTTPTFTGTAEAGATVILYDTDGTTVLGSTVATGGNWSITTSALGQGTHFIQAVAVDAAGNASVRSPGLLVTIDTTPPTLAITSNVASLKAGETATITFTFSEDPGVSFTLGDVTVSGGTLSAISGSGLTRTAIFTPTANTNGGTASITVAAGSYTDTAGNVGGAGATPTLNFDTLAPNAPSAPVMTAASDTGTSSSDNITRNTTPTFTGTAEAGATVRLYDSDGVTVLGSAVATGGNWSITTTALSQGAHTITARATDVAGNEGARSTGLVATIDTTAPTVAITSNISSLKSGETATITFTFSEDPGSTFTWNGSSGDIVVSGGTLSAISGTGLTRTAIFTPTANINSGSASITVTAGSYTDAAGNTGGAGTTPALSFDTLAPNSPSTPSMTAATDTGISSSDGITRNTTPTLTGTAEAGATVTLYDANGVTVLGTGVADGSGNWSITVSSLGEGVHEIDASATDSAGNASSRSPALSVTVITTAPPQIVTYVDFSAPSGVSGGTLLTSSTAHTISGTLSAPLGVHQSVEVSLDNGVTWSNADATIGGSTWMIDGTFDPAGSTIKVRVADAAGNIGATWSQSYTVDTTAPTVTSVSAPPAGTYALGQNLDFVVRFSETVVVNAGGSIPAITLTLDTGGTVQATYVSGSGTDSLVFRYTVANNVQDLTGVTVGAALLHNRQVKDIAGNNAIAALNAVGSTAAVNVDGLDPHVVGVNVINGSGAYGAGSTITIAITYDRVVAVDTFAGTPSFALNSGGVATYASGAGTSTLVFTYTVAPGENAAALDLGGALLLNGGNVADAGGAQANALLALSASLSSHPDIVIDTTPPAIPVIDRIDTSGQQPVLGGTATVAADEHLTVTLGGATYNVAVVNGSWSLDLGSAIPVSGSLSLAPGIAHAVAVTVTDRAGNSSSASAALQVPVSSAAPPSVLRPALDRTPAFMPALPVASWFVPQAAAGMDEMPRTISPFVRPVWGPETSALDDRLFQERDETGARLDDPTADSKRTLGGGFSVVLLAGGKREAGMVVNHGMRDLSLESEAHTDFFIPPDAFAHSNSRAAVYLSATQADGKPLPHWLRFNAATGKFTVDARFCTTAQVSIKVVARDNGGKAAAMQFNIRIGEHGANAGGGNNPAGTSLKSGGCIALSEQIQLAAQVHREPLGAQLAKLVATLPWPEA